MSKQQIIVSIPGTVASAHPALDPALKKTPEKPCGPACLDGNQCTAWSCLEGGRHHLAKAQTNLEVKPGQQEQMEPGQQMLMLFAVSICFSVEL